MFWSKKSKTSKTGDTSQLRDVAFVAYRDALSKIEQEKVTIANQWVEFNFPSIINDIIMPAANSGQSHIRMAFNTAKYRKHFFLRAKLESEGFKCHIVPKFESRDEYYLDIRWD